MEALAEYSRDAQVFVLVHKMDLVAEDERDRVYEERKAAITECSEGFKIQCFKTSIWDETLYKAWSTIVYSLIPNIKTLEDNLGEFASLCDADEVVLFEKMTFLVISNTTRRPHPDMHRFEKISNIVKQFKLSCMYVCQRGVCACCWCAWERMRATTGSGEHPFKRNGPVIVCMCV